MESLEPVRIFIERLDKLNITVGIDLNYPWVYLRTINNVAVKEIMGGNHGFTLGLVPNSPNRRLKFDDIPETFKLIRKYLKKGKKK